MFIQLDSLDNIKQQIKDKKIDTHVTFDQDVSITIDFITLAKLSYEKLEELGDEVIKSLEGVLYKTKNRVKQKKATLIKGENEGIAINYFYILGD